MTQLKVIFDTDPGVDDAMALLLLARHPRITLFAVTTVFGNASLDQVVHNALYLKDLYGFSAPVARGAGRPLAVAPGEPPAFVHGDNGLGDIPLPARTVARADMIPAHQLIIKLVRAHPHEITIIAVGRMTNLAQALAEDPGIAPLVKQVVIMGGAFGYNGHSGNVTAVAEANIIGDPHAADRVLAAHWPIAMVGLDVTMETVMSDQYLAELATTGDDGAFVRKISHGYQDFHRITINLDGFPVHDSSAVAYALHPEFFDTISRPVRVVDHGDCIGQTLAKGEGDAADSFNWDGRAKIRVCTGVESQAVLNFYRQTLVGRAT